MKTLTLTLLLLLAACAPAVEQPTSPPPVTEQAQADGSCAAHGAAEELCFICDPALRDEGRLWCREHARYEDRCWICHPELEDEERLWCKEHSLYEDECFLCHPELLEEQEKPAGEASLGLMCDEHGLPERECGICHPELLAAEAGPGLKVRLPSTDSAAKAGIRVGAPEMQPVGDGVACLAELEFDQNRLAEIAPLVGGVLQAVEVDLGSRVRAGELLATVSSPEIGEAQGDYLRALAGDELHARSLERQRALHAEGISSDAELQEVEAAHRASTAALRQARQRLAVLGFDDASIERGLLELRAPFDGEIVERSVVRGAVVEANEPLFTLADRSFIWAMVRIPESALPRVAVGQPVDLAVESLPGESFRGTLTWLSTRVDDRTRLAEGRVELPNPDGRLKAHMFARALIATAYDDHALVVPGDAVQHVSGTPVVFVKAGEDLFEARPVSLGASRGDRVQVTGGLFPGEPVVVAGGFALKSQLLASRLGAGCVHE